MFRIKNRAGVIKALVLNVEVTNALQDRGVISGEQRQLLELPNQTPNQKNEMFLDMLETGTQNSLKETCQILTIYNQNHVSEMLTSSVDQNGVDISIESSLGEEATVSPTLWPLEHGRSDNDRALSWPVCKKPSFKNIRKGVSKETIRESFIYPPLEPIVEWDITHRNMHFGELAPEVNGTLYARFCKLKGEEDYVRPKVSRLDEALKSYEMAIPIDLSKVTEQQSLINVITDQHPKLKSLRDLPAFMKKHQKKTLFLIDGLETFQLFEHDIMKLLDGELLPRATVIASYRGTRLPENMFWYDQKIECPESLSSDRCRCGGPLAKRFKSAPQEICI